MLIVCLTLLIFTYLTRKSLCEIRYRDGHRPAFSGLMLV
ncbi:Hok/Gef family protein [Escherichia coli]